LAFRARKDCSAAKRKARRWRQFYKPAGRSPLERPQPVSAVNPPTITPVVRLAHLSDIHISARPLGWRLDDYVTKRWTGWINYRWLGRRHRFRGAEQALAAIVEELVRRRPDHVIFSRDAVALSFEAEFARAAALI